jgi:hypothetical protein
MPEFLIFAIAVSMCVLCFAVGFVAALMLRIAGQPAIPTRRSAAASVAPASARAETPQQTVVAAPPAPADDGQAFPLPPAPAVTEPQPAPVSRPAPPLPLRSVTHAVRPGGFATPTPAPPAKVFLFGDPQVETVAAPAFAPAPAAFSPNPQTPKPHVAPPRLPPAEIDLLPHRPQHARSGRGR